MHAPVKFHRHKPYGLGVMARARIETDVRTYVRDGRTKSRADNLKIKQARVVFLFMAHRLNVMHAPVKFHKYIPYGLGVMARTRIRTDVRDGRTGVTLNAHPLFFE